MFKKHWFFYVFALFLTISLFTISIIRTFRFVNYEPSSESTFIYFIFSITTSIVFVLILVKHLRKTISKNHFEMIPKLYLLLKLLTYCNYFSISSQIILAIQIFIFQEYYRAEIELLLWLYYLESIITLVILSFKFFSWSLSTHSLKRSYITISYSISIGLLLLYCIFTILYVSKSLWTLASIIIPHGSETLPYIESTDILKIGFNFLSVLAFIAFWISTIILLYKYSLTIGKIKYSILISLPLLYFLLPFYPGLLSWSYSLKLLDATLFAEVYTVFFSNSIPIGGLLFGLAFWSLGNSIDNKQIKDYMHMAAYGIVLFFASNQAILLSSAPFPPISIAYISLIGFASYMILVGIYSSSISISQDIILRNKIKKAVEKEFIFLDVIGNPELEKQLLKNVMSISLNITNNQQKETGIKTSLDEKDIQNYISEIMFELKNMDNNRDN